MVARRVAGRDMDGQAQAGMRRRCRRLLGALRRGAASCELKKKKQLIGLQIDLVPSRADGKNKKVRSLDSQLRLQVGRR